LVTLLIAQLDAVLLEHWLSQKFWLGEGQNRKILWRLFSDVFRWHNNNCINEKTLFKISICHNQFEKPQFGLITHLQVIKIEDYSTGGGELPALDDFLYLSLK